MTYRNRVFGDIRGGIGKTDRLLGAVVCVVIGIMTLVVFYNVVGRLLFHQPLLGIVELVEMMMVIVGFFAMAYTASKRGHINVDLVIAKLSRRPKTILGIITFFLSAVIVGFITYQSIVNTIYYLKHLKESSTVLSVPVAPFQIVMTLGCLLFSLTLLLDAFHPVPTDEEQKEGRE